MFEQADTEKVHSRRCSDTGEYDQEMPQSQICLGARKPVFWFATTEGYISLRIHTV